MTGVDEVKEHLNSRYISSMEAAGHIFEFPMHMEHPSVYRLSVHLPGEQMVVYVIIIIGIEAAESQMTQSGCKHPPNTNGLWSIKCAARCTHTIMITRDNIYSLSTNVMYDILSRVRNDATVVALL